MLLQQPPTSNIGIIEYNVPTSDCRRPLFSVMNFRPKGDFIRMGHIDKAIYKAVLKPGQMKWSFWTNPHPKPYLWLERKLLLDKKTREPSNIF